MPRACCASKPTRSPTTRCVRRHGEVISGGNFHAEPVAFAADILALAVGEIGAISERRIALLIDAALSGLPPFLVRDGGVNSGFMIAQVTAAALASENKSLAHPASVDSLPTSANQEDHVSMATFAARVALPTWSRTPQRSSPSSCWPPRRASNCDAPLDELAAARSRMRRHPRARRLLDQDRFLAPDPSKRCARGRLQAPSGRAARRKPSCPAAPESTIEFRHRKDTSP